MNTPSHRPADMLTISYGTLDALMQKESDVITLSFSYPLLSVALPVPPQYLLLHHPMG